MRIPTRSTRAPGPGQLALPGLPAPAHPVAPSRSRGLRSVPTGLTASAAPVPVAPARPQRPLGMRPQGPGELQGPAAARRQIQAITMRVEQLDGGRWRFTQPRVPGWVAVGHRAPDVVGAIRRGFTEAQVAAYSDWRGHRTDYDDLGAYRRSKPLKRSKRRCDVYDPAAWRLCDDGRWISPKGLKFAEDRQAVQRVMEARRRMGLTPRPDPVNPEQVQPSSATTEPAESEPVDLDRLTGRGA